MRFESISSSDRPAACSSCPSRHCTQATLFTGAGGVSGWCLVWLSALFFLVPLMLALVGSGVAGPTPNGRFAGAVGGLLFGLALCRFAAIFLRRMKPDSNTPSGIWQPDKEKA